MASSLQQPGAAVVRSVQVGAQRLFGFSLHSDLAVTRAERQVAAPECLVHSPCAVVTGPASAFAFSLCALGEH